MKDINITFEQFIKTYNFRYAPDSDTFDTKIVRIYFGDHDDWFDFGVYDFGSVSDTWERVSKILDKKVLQSYVSQFCYDYKNEVFTVWIDI